MDPVVGCAGILVSDTFCGPMDELPAEGQLLAVDDLPTKAGGCAANVAIGLAKQGIQVGVAGCLGRDASAGVLLSSLQSYGVNCEKLISNSNLPTSKTVILLVSGEDRRYIHSFGANAGFEVAHIDRDWVGSLKVLYLGGLFLMPSFNPVEFIDLLRFCRSKSVISVVDVVIPQNMPFDQNLMRLLQEVDYFLPNDDEAARMTRLENPIDQLRTLIYWGTGTVMVTRGKNGVLAGRGKQFWQAGVYQGLEMLDPSGSGDAFAAGIITGIVKGWEMEKMIRYASALGASANTALGTTDGVFTAQVAEGFIDSTRLDLHSGSL